MNIDKDGKLDIPKCTCNFPAETAREIGHYKDCPRTREKTWWQEKRELNMTTERVKEIMDLFLSKVRKPVSQEQIEWELDFRTHLLYELERMREIIRCERDAEIRKMIEGMEKEQLDKNDPDNYGACYAIGGFNDALAKVSTFLTPQSTTNDIQP